jgi:hypothetical protein
MTAIASLLASIPSAVWSGIIGAVLALCGVLVSNRSNNNRLVHQLQHDAAEKAKERTSNLRCEVYLRTVEELVKSNSQLAGITNVDPTKANMGDAFQGLFSTAARLQLVADSKTALLVNRLVAEYGEFLMDALVLARPAHVARSDINIADSHYAVAQAEVTRLLGEMAKMNESGKPEPAVFAAVQRSFDFQLAQSSTFAEDRNAAWMRFNAANVTYQRAVIAKIRDLGPRQVPVMIELRRDLGLSTQIEELEAQMRENTMRMDSRFNAFLAQQGDG